VFSRGRRCGTTYPSYSKWTITHNITHDALGHLLSCLKVDHPELPLHPRTLKATPRSTDVINLSNGGYTHSCQLNKALTTHDNFTHL